MKQLLDAGPTEKGWHYYEIIMRCLRLAGAREAGAVPPTDAPALVRGSLGHVGLAHVYARRAAARAGRDPDAELFAPHDAVRLLAGMHTISTWDAMTPVALDALDAYHAHYGENDGGEWPEILAVERKLTGRFVAPDGRTVPYRQRADLIVRCADGKIRIVDHKLIGFLDRHTINRYALSGQFLGYEWFGSRLWGDAWGGAILNLIEVGDGKRRFRFRRVASPAAPAAVADLPDAVLDADHEVARMRAEGRPWWRWSPRFNEAICWTLYGPCPLYDACRGLRPLGGGA